MRPGGHCQDAAQSMPERAGGHGAGVRGDHARYWNVGLGDVSLLPVFPNGEGGSLVKWFGVGRGNLVWGGGVRERRCGMG